MYSVCLQVFAAMQTKTTFTLRLNSYNWPFEGKHNADMALSENEFDNLLQCSRMSESRDLSCI